VTTKITAPLRGKADKPLLEVAIEEPSADKAYRRLNNLFFPKRKKECTYTSLNIK